MLRFVYGTGGALTAVHPSVLVELIGRARCDLDLAGYCTLQIAQPSEADTPSARSMLEVLAGGLCQLIEVFSGAGLWRELGVNLSREPDRSGGVGLQPLHLDFVNAALPPDYVLLYCMRPDPNSGGASLIASTAGTSQLSASARAALRRRHFNDGQVVGLSNVGADINPFAVLNPGARFPVRYTAKLLPTATSDAARDALYELEAMLVPVTVEILLSAGELLIVDQRRALHGRSRLGGVPSDVRAQDRRRLLHGFGRDVRGVNDKTEWSADTGLTG